jgi:hypothetical protein
VTRQRAKGLWAYAIERQEGLRQGRADVSRVLWKGDRGVWRAYRSGDRRVFDLLHRDPGGRIDHIFYGVSEWGLTPRWREVVESVHAPLEDVAQIEMEGNGEQARETRSARPAPTPSPQRTGRAGTQGERAAADAGGMDRTPGPAQLPQEPSPEPAAPPPEVEEMASAPVLEEAAPAPAPQPAPEPVPPPAQEPAGQAEVMPGKRIPRWRGPAAVERAYWEGNNLFFDLAMRQDDESARPYRHIHRSQLAESEGWTDLVRVPLPATGVEIVRCTASGDEFLYQFRDPQSGRVDPRVRRRSDFPPDSPYAYAIQMYHQDVPLNEDRGRWWGNIGYLRVDAQRVDLLYRDEEGRDHIYYAAEQALLEGEWQEMLQVLRQDQER